MVVVLMMAEPGEIVIVVVADDDPEWRGPDRGIVKIETGVDASWPVLLDVETVNFHSVTRSERRLKVVR